MLSLDCENDEQRKTIMGNRDIGLGRVAELGSLSSGAKMAMKIFVKRVFTIFRVK